MKPTRYIADRPCIHGHKPERYVSNRVCVQCVFDRNARKIAADPKPQQIRRRRSYLKNQKRHAELGTMWLNNNPEAARARSTRRRGLIRKAEGYHCGEDIQALFKAQKGRCAALHCRIKLPKSYHIDHKTPLVRGGSNWPDNLQLLCQTCNNNKSTKTVSEWRPCS